MKHIQNSTTQNLALLAFRVVIGGSMIIAHGYGKVQRVFSGDPIRFGDPLGIGQELSLYLATGAEFLCSALIVLGLLTRMATLPLIFTMGVIVFVVQIDQPFKSMELPLLYLVAFIVILVYGPGRISIDGLLKKSW